MEKALILDLETNGTDPEKNDIVEMGGVLFSIEHAAVIASFSWLVWAPHNDAVAINGIPIELIQAHGIKQEEAAKRLDLWMARADILIAHNKRFEQGFIDPRCATRKTWVCTQDDVDWPRKSTNQQLVSIALAHGVGVTRAHRALSDCETVMSLFERSAELMVPTRQLLERAMRPKGLFAMVSPRFDAALNEKAKAAGFRWEADRKAWCRRIALEDIETLELPFEIRRIDQ